MDPFGLAAKHRDVRARTLAQYAPLSADDQVVQPMPDASHAARGRRFEDRPRDAAEQWMRLGLAVRG